MRFTSTRSAADDSDRSLADYVAGKDSTQKVIWFVTADTLAAARGSPQLEIFRKKNIEVLLLVDPIDEWLIGHLGGFGELEFRDVRRGDLDLGDDAPGGNDRDAGAHADLLERLQKVLGDEVDKVRVSERLTDSPSCLAIGDFDMGPQLRRILAASGQALPDARPILEINPAHALVGRLAGEQDEERFADFAWLLLEEALLAEGRTPKDPAAFVRRLNRLLG